MSGQGRRLVNKQFNTPINLYSQQSIQETLDRQAQILANGAVGIDFKQLTKPANLQNSAVLRMLEEEEGARQRGGQSSVKRVAWPPPSEDQEFGYVEQSPVQAKTRGISERPSYQSSFASGQQPPSSAFRASPQSYVPSSSPSSPVSPGGGISRQSSYLQQPTAAKSWAPVSPPLATSPTPQQASQQAPWRTQQQPVQSSRQQQQQQQQQRQNQPVTAEVYAAPVVEPPPSIITLRPNPPISQVPSPVYQAQPAATKAPASGTMRGDLKWPPPSVKAQVEAEHRAQLELTKGPAVRPRRVNKDYTGFFAQNALNSTYPGYRVPPGTQYFTPTYQH